MCDYDFLQKSKLGEPNKDLANYLSNLAIPKGSLGRLMELGIKVYELTGLICPSESDVICIVYAADHGVARNNVSAFPIQATYNNVVNMIKGKAAVNRLCSRIGCRLEVVDIGVINGDLLKNIKQAQPRTSFKCLSWRQGTENSLVQPAMNHHDVLNCLDIGMRLVEKSSEKIVVLGEMGIGNTTTSAVLQSLIQDIPITACVGRGSGISDEILKHKTQICSQIIQRVQEQYNNKSTVLNICAEVGGFEILAMVGSIIKAAQTKRLVILDGYMAAVAALIAYRLNSSVTEVLIAATKSTEKGQTHILKELNLTPYLDFNLRLGEATGALSLIPTILLSTTFLTGMSTLDDLKRETHE